MEMQKMQKYFRLGFKKIMRLLAQTLFLLAQALTERINKNPR